jgi:ribonuclease E
MSKSQMLISYSPGEECRVAVVENGRLEEFHHERASNISRVGNIYVGRVTNVEASIQAAFIDFGVEQHGFLHVTDLHPRYFPGEDVDETTERVGKKTPRRDRPPIQRALRRGQEITVQVLKEGVGTKGPTLTSYLSIPGRFLVMMPQMDRVGVSRKVEDEELRRKMREILDQLELPEGFGFIVRTAGLDRNKTDLKRDLAYLARLWKDMEARRVAGDKPRLLYSESDLLVRALRDMLAPEIEEVVIDHDAALNRAAGFLKIVAPRSRVKLFQYQGNLPLFHAFGVEQQVALIHAREVPLPGGGRLVIDETEALVAIDVNSGKMRDARDAETNAYRTNLEAVDEICRQLKLRDLGGIVINDLIDMRHASHRKDIETRFKERLKRDRAKTTVLPISDFGILEMTRQRMRGSHESVHFSECPTCRGRGLVQRPESTTSDALRNLAALLDHKAVAKVEMVVNPRVAGELLSGRRQSLGRLERRSGKHVDVRVSEALPIDRVNFYAYDEAGADIDVDRLPRTALPTDLKEWELPRDADEAGWAGNLLDESAPAPLEPEPEDTVAQPHPIELDAGEEADFGTPAPSPAPDGGKKRRRRRRRGKGALDRPDGQPAGAAPEPGAVLEFQAANEPAPPSVAEAAPHGAGDDPHQMPSDQPAEGGRRRRRRRRRRGRGGRGPDGTHPATESGQPIFDAAQPPAPPEGPRGDSWDVEPPTVATEPVDGTPMTLDGPAASPGVRQLSNAATPVVNGDDLSDVEESEQPGPVAPGGAPDGGGRRKRRRRRRRRGGQRGEPGGAPGSPPADQPRASAPMPATPSPRPVTPSPSLPQPAPGAPQPKRFLYSTRRRLAPGEAAKRPRE